MHQVTEHLLYSSWKHSVSKGQFKDMLEMWHNIDVNIACVPHLDEEVRLYFELNYPISDISEIISFCDWLRWDISEYQLRSDPEWKPFDKDNYLDISFNKNLLSMKIHPLLDMEYWSEDLDKFECLYYATPSVNDFRIQQNGIVVKEIENISYHSNRLYFGRTIIGTARMFRKFNPDVKEFSIYRVDIKKAVKGNSQIRIFTDFNYKSGLYTLSDINLEYINFLRTVKVKSDDFLVDGSPK